MSNWGGAKSREIFSKLRGISVTERRMESGRKQSGYQEPREKSNLRGRMKTERC